MKRMQWIAAGLLLCCAGCETMSKRLNAPPHGVPQETSDLQGTFVYMQDNALLADMSVSDYHFLPHRATLTTLGKQRIERLASLIDAYGGTIRFNSDLADESQVRARTDAIVAYLAELGVDTSKPIVQRGNRGGEGLPAAEAILIKQHEGTFDPEKNKTSQSDAGSLTDK